MNRACNFVAIERHLHDFFYGCETHAQMKVLLLCTKQGWPAHKTINPKLFSLFLEHQFSIKPKKTHLSALAKPWRSINFIAFVASNNIILDPSNVKIDLRNMPKKELRAAQGLCSRGWFETQCHLLCWVKNLRQLFLISVTLLAAFPMEQSIMSCSIPCALDWLDPGGAFVASFFKRRHAAGGHLG